MHTRHFTLVEVLISMAVLAVFMLGLLQFYSMSQNTMRLAADRSELYERARIAMDMMTQDIVCTYYSQTETGLVPFAPKNSGSANHFEVVTVRPEKLKTSGGKTPVTTLLGVKYWYEDGKHALYYATDQDRDTFSVEDASWGEGTELIGGVTAFEVKPNIDNSVSPLPKSVRISLELVDKTAMRRAENTGNSSILTDAPKRRFERTVFIDRGQIKERN